MSDALKRFMEAKPQSSPVQRPATERAERAENVESGEPDEIDYRAYGANRSGRQVIMLDVRTLKGKRLALPYSYLNRIFFDASGEIVLTFEACNVIIIGRNLSLLYEKLLSHSVRYIQEENPELEINVSGNDTFIASIEIEEPQ